MLSFFCVWNFSTYNFCCQRSPSSLKHCWRRLEIALASILKFGLRVGFFLCLLLRLDYLSYSCRKHSELFAGSERAANWFLGKPHPHASPSPPSQQVQTCGSRAGKVMTTWKLWVSNRESMLEFVWCMRTTVNIPTFQGWPWCTNSGDIYRTYTVLQLQETTLLLCMTTYIILLQILLLTLHLASVLPWILTIWEWL